MKIKQAVIMAAGFGERLLPLTATTPKPLLRVDGKPMIEHLIETLIEREYEHIIVVVGYMAHRFDYLTHKYRCIKIVKNYNYDRMNNIASLYVVRRYLTEPTVILDGDQIINNPEIIQKDITHSGYVCYRKEDDEKEWTLDLNENNKIRHCDTDTQAFDYVLRSISFWTTEDLERLVRCLNNDFTNERRHWYWDNVPMSHLVLFDLYGYIIQKSDLTEIDTIEEYRKLQNGGRK